MHAAGLSSHRLIRFGTPPVSIKDGDEVGENLKQYFDDIDCVCCVSDSPAFVVQRVLQEQGIQGPNNVGVAGSVGSFIEQSFKSSHVRAKRIQVLFEAANLN